MTAQSETTAPTVVRPAGGLIGARGLLGRLVLLAVVLLLAGQIALAWLSVAGFEQELEPQLGKKAHAVGLAVANQVKFAVDDLGIPPDELVGVETFFDGIMDSNSDIEYMTILSPQSEALFVRGLSPGMLDRVLPGLPGPDAEMGHRVEVAGFIDGTFPVVAGGSVVAVLHVGASKKYVRNRLSEMLYEVIIVIVVSWLVTLEFLMFFMNTRISEPMEVIRGALDDGARGIFANRFVLRARDEIGQIAIAFNRMLQDLGERHEDLRFEARELEGAQIDESVALRIRKTYEKVGDGYRFTGGKELRSRSGAMQIRVPLFLFIFSEELSRSFLPLFAARLSPIGVASDDLLIGLPITLFMLATVITIPIGAGLAERFGARRIFLSGVAAAVAGYIGTFLIQGYYDFVAWRVLTGIGYGLTFIAAQSWVSEHTEDRSRAQGMAVFVGALLVGAVCGPPIGGIFADRIGFEATFLISAGLAAVSAMIAYSVLGQSKGERKPHQFMLGRKEWLALLCDIRFLAVAMFSALPGKILLAGFLFYMVPLYLNELGNSQAAIGRIIMLYGIATVACTSLSARFADSSGRYTLLVIAGGILSGVGCFSVLFDAGLGGASNAVIFATLALGVGHGLSLTSQLSIIHQVANDHREMIGRSSVVGAYRLVDRIGLVLGPIIAGVLVSRYGYQGTMIGVGLIVLGGIAVCATMLHLPTTTSALRRSEAT